ncbi:hypothetical protein [Gloeothece verrucosa]|uniref:Uncharacterized protein n=1 Tax=Gloeothece verrucosa (strain PCC 7822) TaxID=497965 RepID=E0U5A0_GLOV7|nr:hypothetical protein [Gloeothece verrucosa]ADN13490.1 hypothetical protein Cyan7822_1494 [Gloeothece verrucosa PCC 7822]
MLKRLFLAGTITFPLYLLVHIDGAAKTSAFLQPQLTQKASQVVSELQEDISQFHQELSKLKTTFTESENLLMK